jgi:prepilin-type N-terminal cleavage/methylation domain-containing protein
MATNRLRQSGFSLLELIIVLMLMISLLAIAWPNLQRPLRRTTLSEAAQTLRSAIDDIRYQAIVTGKPLFIELRQNDGLIRAGSFDDFMNRDAAGLGTTRPTALPTQPTDSQQSRAGQLSAIDQSSLKTWTLPKPVVISLVRWTLAAPVEEFEPTQTVEANALAEVQSDSMVDLDSNLQLDRGAAQQTWWLPLVPTGQGRDAAITLHDSTVNQQITVTFASATGALEISR